MGADLAALAGLKIRERKRKNKISRGDIKEMRVGGRTE